MRKILLLSGGLDSSALAYAIRPDLAFTVLYGQAAGEAEVEASKAICHELGTSHEVLRADFSFAGLGDMSTNRREAGSENSNYLPSSDWWPLRNQFLITVVAARCLAMGVQGDLFTGTVSSDARFADGTVGFYSLMDELFTRQEGGLRLYAPAIKKCSAELLRESKMPEAIARWTHSCHCFNVACGMCRGCRKRGEVMIEVWGSP